MQMTKFLKTQQTRFLICHLKYSNNLITLFLKKLKWNQFFEQHPKKIFQIFLNKVFEKWKIFLLMMMNLINDFVIIPDNEKAKISNLLLKTDIQIRDNLKWKKNRKTESHTEK